MNPSLLGAAAATLLVALWLLGRRKPRPFLRSADTSAVAALNRAQIERQLDPASTRLAARGGVDTPEAPTTPPPPGGPSPAAALATYPIPARGDLRGRRLLLQRLEAASAGPLGERIAALGLARRWGHPAVLPLLRRGLRDVHPAVVREAALALEAYRGRTIPSTAATSLPVRSPRRVSRTR